MEYMSQIDDREQTIVSIVTWPQQSKTIELSKFSARAINKKD